MHYVTFEGHPKSATIPKSGCLKAMYLESSFMVQDLEQGSYTTKFDVFQILYLRGIICFFQPNKISSDELYLRTNSNQISQEKKRRN